MRAATSAKLHDFYQPAPPSWMPQTIGWYVLFALLAVALAWWAFRVIRRWRANRYRREALRVLPATPASQLSALLKRTALSAWPRQDVAALTGASWLAFLNRTTPKPAFAEPPATVVEDIALHPDPLPSSDEAVLREKTAHWIRNHHVSP